MLSQHSKNDPYFQRSIATGLLYKSVDLLAILAAALLPAAILFDDFAWPDSRYQVAMLMSLLLALIVFERFDLYQPWRGRSLTDQAGSIILAWTTVFGLLIIGAFLLKSSSHFSRVWSASWYALGFVCLFAARALTMIGLRSLRRRGWNHKQAIIVGAGSWGREVAARLKAAEWMGLDIVAFFDPDDTHHGDDIDGAPVVGHYDRLPEFLENTEVDDIWICLPADRRDRDGVDHVGEVLHLLRHSTINRRMVPDLADMRLLNRPVIEILGLPVVSLNSAPLHGVNRILKSLEDIILASITLVLLSPLLIGIGLSVKLTSSGPVFFRQERHGWDGRPFFVYKFRTMVPHGENGDQVTQATKADPRVTRLGQFLRRTSLDELPQLINVLRGEMSIVGPRPHAIAHNEHYKDYIDSYMQRHMVKPGITGWAQVNGWRGETDTIEKMRRRVEFDLYYIENWSILFDLKIIFRTLFSPKTHTNAY